MNYTIPTLSLVFISINLLLGLMIPAALFLYFKKKYSCSMRSFFIGCAVMLIFALGLEQIVHSLVLSTPIGSQIQNNTWLIAIYGGLMAGLFEESGRYIVFRTVLRKDNENNHNALMYGAGHGGFEAFVILTISSVNNLIYAILIATGNAQLILNGLDEATSAIVKSTLDQFATTSPWLFLASPLERIAALAAQLALSVLVWFAAKNRKSFMLFPLAIALHAALDFTAASLSGLGINVMLIELCIFVLSAIFVLLAVLVWRKNKKLYNSDNAICSSI